MRGRHRRWPDGLGARIATVLVGFVVLVTSAVTAAAYVRGRGAVLRGARAEAEARAALAADRLQRELEQRRSVLQLWAALGTSQDLAGSDPEGRLSASLDELAAGFGADALALAVDTAGRVVSASDRSRVGERAAAEPWFPRGSVGPTFQLGLSGRLAATAPVRRAGDDRLLGYLVLLSSWQSLARGVREREAVTVRSVDGRLLAAAGRTDTVRLLWSAPRRVRVGRARVVVAAGILEADALRPLRAESYRLMGFAALVLGLTLPTLLLLVHSATAELSRLTAAARSGGEGLTVSAAAPLEVRVLAGALRGMLDRLEESRREMARQESLAAMGTMAAALAHEIRTPLAVLRGSAEMVARRAAAHTREAEVAAFMIEEVDRMERLVSDMLLFASPRHPEPECCDLAALAARACDLLEPLARGAGVDLARELAPAPCRGDPVQLQQVVLNLVTNAIQASPAGGAVTVTVRRSVGGPRLEVSDHGPGIPADAAERIWEPFFSRRRGGTGLGLPIVKRIVQAHRGRVEAEPVPGGGTRMVVRLPGGEGTS